MARLFNSMVHWGWAALFLTLPAIAEANEPRQPNIVLFLVDDMGWTDCGAYGSQYYETPNVDRFARESMRFTNAYAHPLCSPSRASIMTGQEESRHGILSAHGHLEPEPWGPPVYQDNPSANQPFLLPKSRRYLDPDSVTLAEALQAAGYQTAHLGKWHLGLTAPHWPEAHGFETTFHCAPDPGPPSSTYFSPHNVHADGTPTPKHRVGNISDGPDGQHIADRLAEEAIQFITTHQDQPFFLNLWQYSVHGPWEAKQEYLDHFANKQDPAGRHSNPVMAAMLKSMDDSLGAVLETLDALKLAENTIFIFYSDNGGNTHSWATQREQDRYINNPNHDLHDVVNTYRQFAGFQSPTNNSPLRSGKGSLYEGGQRVPLMVRWPGQIQANSTSDAIINNIDLYPTLLDLIGVPLPKNHPIDGASFSSVLLGGGSFQRNTSFGWFPYHNAGISLRQGDWKLIRRFKANPSLYEGMVELYDLKNDLGEANNLATQMPDKVAELGKLIDDHFAKTTGLYPKPNPGYQAADSVNKKSPNSEQVVPGLVARQCEVQRLSDFIRVVPTGQVPFLGTAQVKLQGPLILSLRARTLEKLSCNFQMQWRTRDQTQFPEDSQKLSFQLAENDSWQDIKVPIPVQGQSQLIRLYLPPQTPVEIQSIRYEASGQPVVQWSFSE